MTKARRLYYCRHCKRTIARVSDKQWVQSFCDATGRSVHLTLAKRGQ